MYDGLALACLRLQPQSPTVAASRAYGCSLSYLRLQPRVPTIAASVAYGCSLGCLRLQPRLPTVAASVAYGCRRETIMSSLKRRATKLVAALNALEGVSCNEPQGSMYAFPKVTLPAKAQAAAAEAGKAADTFYALARQACDWGPAPTPTPSAVVGRAGPPSARGAPPCAHGRARRRARRTAALSAPEAA